MATINLLEWTTLLTEIVNKNFNFLPNNISYYIQAFTHSSFSNEHKSNLSYERLEFLGDSIIQFYISDFLFHQNTLYDEKSMTNIRKELVNSLNLAKQFDKFFSTKLIFVGNGVREITTKLKEDIIEAFVAAVYLDRGANVVELLIRKLFLDSVNVDSLNLLDYKTMLQECLQKAEGNKKNQIKYEGIRLENGQWQVKLILFGELFGEGVAARKKDAEQLAAKEALSKNSLISQKIK